jgi:hypothetical protein
VFYLLKPINLNQSLLVKQFSPYRRDNLTRVFHRFKIQKRRKHSHVSFQIYRTKNNFYLKISHDLPYLRHVSPEAVLDIGIVTGYTLFGKQTMQH